MPCSPPRAGPSFASTSPWAERSASLTAATTMSSSISGSSGSMAFGSILISVISPSPVAVTVTTPPPAVAWTFSCFSSSWAFCICDCICWTCSSILFMSKLTAWPPGGRRVDWSFPTDMRAKPTRPDVGIASDASLWLHLSRVECSLHQFDNLLLAHRFLGNRLTLTVLADLELEGQMAARHLVERLLEQRRVLRLAGEALGVRLAQHRGGRDRLLLDGRKNRPLPGLLKLLELERRRISPRQGHCLFGPRFGDSPLDRAGMDTAFQELEAMRGRLAREIRCGPRHLHERELEREARVAALALILDGHREQVAQPQHRRLWKLVRLLPQSVARLLGDRERLGHLAEVLDEQQVAQVLEQVGHEPPEILPLL